MKETKALFLDMDGVLCTDRSHYGGDSGKFMQDLDGVGVRMLARLCRETKTEVVLSSTWRTDANQRMMSSLLSNAGWGGGVPWHTCWKTPESKRFSGCRGDEIAEWMQHNGTPSRYAILDDDNDMLEAQQPHFVRTDSYNGIQWANLKKLAELLGLKGLPL